MRDPQKDAINIEPGTIVLMVSALLLLTLLSVGFSSQ